MTPFDFAPGDAPERSSAPAGAFDLTLAFSKAADYGRIDDVFSPTVKQAWDPEGYIVKRHEPFFRRAVDNGSAAFLRDPAGNVMALTIAYRFNRDAQTAPGVSHDYTELGTTFARLPGFHSAALIVAAIALREWWVGAPSSMMMAEVKSANIPSLKVYRDKLEWHRVPDGPELDTVYDASYQTVANPDGTGPAEPPPPAARAGEEIYACDDRSLAAMAQILLIYMNQGGLFHSRTGQVLRVDFSAIEAEGLTAGRLQALAAGETSRESLRLIAG